MPETSNIQRVELINYKNDAGKELLGLGIELSDDPDGGIKVRVLMDPQVVSGVTVTPLQQSSCCG
mgnify:FL=1